MKSDFELLSLQHLINDGKDELLNQSILARSDGFSQSDINGHEMINDAEDIIEKGRYYIGGKIVYLDCRELLIEFYKKNGYVLVTQNPFPNGYYKMFKTLPPLTF
jgi:hypothetical protein